MTSRTVEIPFGLDAFLSPAQIVTMNLHPPVTCRVRSFYVTPECAPKFSINSIVIGAIKQILGPIPAPFFTEERAMSSDTVVVHAGFNVTIVNVSRVPARFLAGMMLEVMQTDETKMQNFLKTCIASDSVLKYGYARD